MFSKISRFLWGELTKDKLKKFGILSLSFFFIIGFYWLLRPLKDGIFISFVGVECIPWVKILSVSILLPVVLLYSKLVNLV
jgi:ATP:ADP antiporter, AAA family